MTISKRYQTDHHAEANIETDFKLINQIKMKSMHTNEPIKKRNNGKTTRYFLAGEMLVNEGIGQFHSALQKWYDNIDGLDTTLKLAAVTADFIYYIDEEDGDETAGTVMLDRELQLIDDGFLAYNDLAEIVEENKGLLWMSDNTKYWQREQHIQPDKITPQIKEKLSMVNIDKLTKKEKAIYFAYLNNGPVQYTKEQSLTAILFSDVWFKRLSKELSAIRKMFGDQQEND